jgi:hypothetical protein
MEATVDPAESLPAAGAEPDRGPLYEWNGKGRAITRIEVNVDRQKAVFYSGDEQIGWSTVASGVRSYPTPTGRYTIQEKIVEKKSNLYGKIYDRNGRLVRSNAERGVHPIPPGGRFEGAKMPYFMRMSGDGIGMHAGPLPAPGSPASHGCVRMPHSLAPIVFRHVDIGTSVSVVGSGPTYAQYMAAERRQAERRAAAAAPSAAPSAAAAINAATAEAAAPAAGGPGGPVEAAGTAPAAPAIDTASTPPAAAGAAGASPTATAAGEASATTVPAAPKAGATAADTTAKAVPAKPESAAPTPPPAPAASGPPAKPEGAAPTPKPSPAAAAGDSPAAPRPEAPTTTRAGT